MVAHFTFEEAAALLDVEVDEIGGIIRSGELTARLLRVGSVDCWVLAAGDVLAYRDLLRAESDRDLVEVIEECPACVAAGVECEFHAGFAAGWDACASVVAAHVEAARREELAPAGGGSGAGS